MECNFEGCVVVADKRCGKCREVFYCCAEHQKLDWRKHKHTCRSNSSEKAPTTKATAGDSSVDLGDQRQCRCMFCGEQLLLASEEAAVDHMRVCPALQEQLASPEQYTIPKAFQKIVEEKK